MIDVAHVADRWPCCHCADVVSRGDRPWLHSYPSSGAVARGGRFKLFKGSIASFEASPLRPCACVPMFVPWRMPKPSFYGSSGLVPRAADKKSKWHGGRRQRRGECWAHKNEKLSLEQLGRHDARASMCSTQHGDNPVAAGNEKKKTCAGTLVLAV